MPLTEVNVDIIAGQSNAEGLALRDTLAVDLRGAQASRFIFNFENNAVEVLNVDGAGANLPNNTTAHINGVFGLELSFAKAALAATSTNIYLFKHAILGSTIGPMSLNLCWAVSHSSLIVDFANRWNAFVAAMALLGLKPKARNIIWFQGESDAALPGNEGAYLSLFTQFKKTIRDTVGNPAALWITCLISNTLYPTVNVDQINRANTVRSAQYKAGWSDPNYRIIDTNRFSRSVDFIHLDTEGQVALGEAVWALSLTTVNNSMALQDYDLLSLRTRMATDFGIDLTVPENVVTLDEKINDGIAWIQNRRKNWPWNEREVSFDLGEQTNSVSDTRYGAGIFTLAQRQVVGCSYNLTSLKDREIINFDTARALKGLTVVSSNGGTAYIKQAYSGDQQICNITSIVVGNPTIINVSLVTNQGGTATIPTNVPTFGVRIAGTGHATPAGTYDGTYQATRLSATQFSIPVNSTGFTANTFGTAQIAREFVIAQSYVELPDDFIRGITLHTDEDTEENTIYFRPTEQFEREIKTDRTGLTLSRIYTVVFDPVGTTQKKFLALYPFFTGRETLHLKYYGDTKKLVADSDIPDIPRSDRIVVLYAAGWFVAQWQKDSNMIPVYRDGALNELERMAKEYQFSDDLTENVDIGSDDMFIPRGPGGFPEFQEP